MRHLLAAAASLWVIAAPARAAGAGPLPFVEDDWPRALAAANERDLPIFVDVWAPW
jgi:hypothetical protein